MENSTLVMDPRTETGEAVKSPRPSRPVEKIKLVFELFASPDMDQYALQLACMDAVVGARLRMQRDQLIKQGLSPEDAKAQVYPDARGRPFHEVYRKAKGRPMAPCFGSAAVTKREVIPFMFQVAILKAALGISHMDGGGPEVMATSAYLAKMAQELVARLGITPTWKPENFRVLLGVGKEAPHPFTSDENTVWACNTLTGRPEEMAATGILIIAEYYPGGFGTLEEFGEICPMNQLYRSPKLVFPIRATVPMVLIDFEMPPKGNRLMDRIYRKVDNVLRRVFNQPRNVRTFWTLPEQAENFVEERTIKPEHAAFVHRIMANDPKGLERYVEILRKGTIDHLGYDLIAAWEDSIGKMPLVQFVRETAESFPISVDQVLEAARSKE